MWVNKERKLLCENTNKNIMDMYLKYDLVFMWKDQSPHFKVSIEIPL